MSPRAPFTSSLSWIIVACALGCAEPEIFETKITFESNGPACGAALDGDAVPMDTAVLVIEEAAGPNCGVCANGGCTRVATLCRCAPAQAVTIENLAAMMGGVRIEGVDASRAYCMTIATLEAGHGRKSTSDCPCQPGWLDSARFAQTGRMCGGSRGSINPEGVEMSVNCRDNGRDIDISDCLDRL